MYSRSQRGNPWAALLIASFLMTGYSCTATSSEANAQQEPAITGTIRTSDGSPLYGILVNAKGEGQKYTTSFVTDDQGLYEFPPLPFGFYRVSVGTQWSERVNFTSSGVTQDFVVELGPGFMTQTTGTSWLNLLPGTQEDKKRLSDSCGSCHSIWRLIDRPQTSKEGWSALARKMARITTTGEPLDPDAPYRLDLSEENFNPLMDYLTKNIVPELKEKQIVEAMVRPRGEAARAVFTEWDLSGEVKLVKATWTDSAGISWFAADTLDDFGAVGRLAPSTGEVKVWPTSLPKPTFHDILGDSEENLWITASTANKIVKFDTSTYQYSMWDVPEASRWAHTGDLDPDGNFWFTLQRGEEIVAKLEPGTGKMTRFPPMTKRSGPYGLVIDRSGDVWFTQLRGHKVSKIVRATGKLTEFDPPTPLAGPRRIQMDSQGKLWFTEFYADKIVRLDQATMEFTEYDTGVPGGSSYFIVVDKHDQIWINLLNGNVIGKFDPTTEKFTYLLFPQPESHSRNASLDHSTDPIGVVYERAFLAQKDFTATIGRMHIRGSNSR